MAELYHSKYYSNLSIFLAHGWSDEEINKYFPILETLSAKELLQLHTLCHIQMYRSSEKVDKEQAINVLVNPSDTPKSLLMEALDSLML